MTEEVKNDVVEIPQLIPENLEMPLDLADPTVEVAPVKEEAKPQYSEHELKAMASGWKPKDQFEGDLDEWKPAKAFLKDGELYERIQDLNKHVKSQKEQISALVSQQDQISRISYEKAMQDLKKQQRDAVEIGDYTAVEQTTDMITQLKEQQKAQVVTPTQPELPAPAAAFMERNKDWFNENNAENRSMKAYAIAKDDELRNANPYASMEDRFAQVEKHVKEFYSNKFENAARERAPTVANNASAAPKQATGTVLWNQLPEQHKKVFLAFKEVNPKISLTDMVQKWKEQGVL